MACLSYSEFSSQFFDVNLCQWWREVFPCVVMQRLFSEHRLTVHWWWPWPWFSRCPESKIITQHVKFMWSGTACKAFLYVENVKLTFLNQFHESSVLSNCLETPYFTTFPHIFFSLFFLLPGQQCGLLGRGNQQDPEACVNVLPDRLSRLRRSDLPVARLGRWH